MMVEHNGGENRLRKIAKQNCGTVTRDPISVSLGK